MMDHSCFLVEKPLLFSFRECLWFLDRDYDDCLFRIENNVLFKAILVDSSVVLFSLSEAEDHLEVKILKGEVSEKIRLSITKYITEWFDLKKNLQPFYYFLQQDPRLSYMTKEYHGLRLIGIEDLFEALCWSIIGQQINLNFAYRLKRRLVTLCGTEITFENQQYHLFPKPERVITLTISELQALQFSKSKARYILEVSNAFVENKLSKELLVNLSTFEDRQKLLRSIKGVGVWTANYVLMKTLRDSNSIPFGDVGLLKALVSHKIIEQRGENEKILAFFSNFKGWESYLVFYLWRSLSSPVFHNK